MMETAPLVAPHAGVGRRPPRRSTFFACGAAALVLVVALTWSQRSHGGALANSRFSALEGFGGGKASDDDGGGKASSGDDGGGSGGKGSNDDGGGGKASSGDDGGKGSDDDGGGGNGKASDDDDDGGGGGKGKSSDDDDDGGGGGGGKGRGSSSPTTAPTVAEELSSSSFPVPAPTASEEVSAPPTPIHLSSTASPSPHPTLPPPPTTAPSAAPSALPSYAPSARPTTSAPSTGAPTRFLPTNRPSFSGGVGARDDDDDDGGAVVNAADDDDATIVITTPDDDGTASTFASLSPTSTTPTPSATFGPTISLAPTGRSLSLFKRTHASADAEADAAFVREFFGLNVTTNETFSHPRDPGSADGGGRCSKRMSLTAMPDFELHYFESAVTPDGPVPVADWVAYWRALAAGFERERWDAWDAFLWNSITFYSPDLTPFVRKLTARGVPVFCAAYNRSLERDDDDLVGDVPLYSASVVVPHTGHVIEVVSEHVDRAARGPFARWPAAACPKAVEVSQSVGDLRRAWLEEGGTMRNGFGLPDLLVTKVAFAGDVDAFESFINKVALDTTDTVTRTASSYAQDDDVGSAPVSTAADVGAAGDDGGAGDADAQLCSWASVNLDGFMADLRVVEGPSARDGARTVEMWTGYVDAVHDRWTGEDEGWDRWLDVSKTPLPSRSRAHVASRSPPRAHALRARPSPPRLPRFRRAEPLRLRGQPRLPRRVRARAARPQRELPRARVRQRHRLDLDGRRERPGRRAPRLLRLVRPLAQRDERHGLLRVARAPRRQEARRRTRRHRRPRRRQPRRARARRRGHSGRGRAARTATHPRKGAIANRRSFL